MLLVLLLSFVVFVVCNRSWKNEGEGERGKSGGRRRRRSGSTGCNDDRNTTPFVVVVVLAGLCVVAERLCVCVCVCVCIVRIVFQPHLGECQCCRIVGAFQVAVLLELHLLFCSCDHCCVVVVVAVCVLFLFCFCCLVLLLRGLW